VAELSCLPAAERRASLRHLIDETASLVRELHRRRLSHRDLKAANILVRSSRFKVQAGPVQAPTLNCIPGSWHLDLWFIDLVGVSSRRRLPRARRVQNLARLHASFTQTTALTRTDKVRFLRVYLQWGLLGRSTWKRWWKEVEQATRVKIARNLRSGRPLA
jgi:serine/threonine protein kinase